MFGQGNLNALRAQIEASALWDCVLRQARGLIALAPAITIAMGLYVGFEARADEADDIASAVKDAATKLSKYQGDKEVLGYKLAAQINEVDAALQPYQDKKSGKRAILLTDRLAQVLTNLSPSEAEPVLAKLTLLDAQLTALIKTRGPAVHIIEATYGDHRTGRTCAATNYFLGACEGKNKCPSDDAAVVNGETACGFEPAPLAAPGANAAHVHYTCVTFGLRPWADIVAKETKGFRAILRSKGRILCNPR